MAIYATEMTKLEVSGNLVVLQPGSSKLFSKNDVIIKYEVAQNSNVPRFIVFYYYTMGDVDVFNYTTPNV